MQECVVVVSGNINNQEKVDAYKSVAGPIMAKYGATMPPQSNVVSSVLAGQAKPEFMLQISFSDKEKALAAFEDDAYKAVVANRDEGFGDLSIFMIE